MRGADETVCPHGEYKGVVRLFIRNGHGIANRQGYAGFVTQYESVMSAARARFLERTVQPFDRFGIDRGDAV